jgi:5-methylcytosine-specific restriction endonuclease McrA
MATRDQWAVLRAEKLEAQSCRLMVRLDGWNRLCCNTLELHHIIPRSQGGDDVADNLLPLCSWHHGMVTLRDEGYLQNLAAALTDAEYAYVIGKLGEGALERLFGVSR